MPAVIMPVFFLSAVSAFCAAHAAASAPFGSINARARDVYAPDVLPIATSSYNPDVAASKIGSDSIPGRMSRAVLRIFKSFAKFTYSEYRPINSLPPGNSTSRSPPGMFFPAP